tara:strand:+ start:1873 stop:2328 length:456 start_codon:yes stop_codon:yes gene_type:complete
MEHIVAEFLFDLRNSVVVKQIDAEKLETYICNEIIDENGNILIDLPEVDLERKGYKSNKYDKEILKRQRDRNRKRVNQNNMSYMKRRYHSDEAFRRQHLDRCMEIYYRKKKEKQEEKTNKILEEIQEKHTNINPDYVKQIKEKGFFVLKFD